MGWGGDDFYLFRPHTLLSYTYPLLYLYPAWRRNQISFPSLTNLGVLAPSHPRNEFFFWIKKSILQSRTQYCNAIYSKETMTIDDYGEGEERGRESEA